MPKDSYTPEDCLPFAHRDCFPEALNKLGLLGNGAEIGVQDGFYSNTLLQKWKGQCLYSIDPWKEFESSSYQDIANIQQEAQDMRYEGAKKLLGTHGERSKIVRMTSHEAAQTFEKDFFDFVYIDANHHYESVAVDIRLWFPKVKTGGIIAGHDYIPDGMYTAGLFGVVGAVNEFAAKRNLRVYISGEPWETQNVPPSWFIVKQ